MNIVKILLKVVYQLILVLKEQPVLRYEINAFLIHCKYMLIHGLKLFIFWHLNL